VSRRSSLQAVIAPEVDAPARAPLRERLRRETAAGILVAAEDVFASSGLAKAHVEDIARRAGVAVGTLYNYYRDRDALLAAALSERIDELAGDLEGAVERHSGSPARETLLALSRAYLAFFIRRRTFVRILVEGELAQLKDAYPTSAPLASACWQSFRDVFTRVIRQGVGAGELPGAHAELDVWLFMGLLRGVVMRDLRAGVPCQEADADRLVSVFFDGATR
jgi:AcrR family transcriptional regulator